MSLLEADDTEVPVDVALEEKVSKLVDVVVMTALVEKVSKLVVVKVKTPLDVLDTV